MATPSVPAISLLEQFLEANGLKQSDAARAVGVSAATMHDWLDSAMRPKASYREAIEKWTSGAVPASSWETPEERAIVDAVRPFEAVAKPQTKAA